MFDYLVGRGRRTQSQIIAVRVEFTFERKEVSLAALLSCAACLSRGHARMDRSLNRVALEVARGARPAAAHRAASSARCDARGVVRWRWDAAGGNGGRVRTGATRRGRGRGVGV